MVLGKKVYKKLKGRAYRCYYKCVVTGCPGQVMVNDLKGGSLKLIDDHFSNCDSHKEITMFSRL